MASTTRKNRSREAYMGLPALSGVGVSRPAKRLLLDVTSSSASSRRTQASLPWFSVRSQVIYANYQKMSNPPVAYGITDTSFEVKHQPIHGLYQLAGTTSSPASRGDVSIALPVCCPRKVPRTTSEDGYNWHGLNSLEIHLRSVSGSMPSKAVPVVCCQTCGCGALNICEASSVIAAPTRPRVARTTTRSRTACGARLESSKRSRAERKKT